MAAAGVAEGAAGDRVLFPAEYQREDTLVDWVQSPSKHSSVWRVTKPMSS